MRIAMMTNNYKPFVGGVPISIERLADSLRALGNTVYIFAPDYKPMFQMMNIRFGFRQHKKELQVRFLFPVLCTIMLRESFQHWLLI